MSDCGCNKLKKETCSSCNPVPCKGVVQNSCTPKCEDPKVYPCDPCNQQLPVATPFINCDIVRCNEGCEETFPLNCLTGCKVFINYLERDCEDGKTIVSINPTFFNEGTLGWELILNDVLHSTNVGQKNVTFVTTELTTVVIKVRDLETGCEGSKTISLRGCSPLRCYRLTIPRTNPADDIYAQIAINAFYDITDTISDSTSITYYTKDTIQPQDFFRFTMAGIYVDEYYWVNYDC